MQTLTHTIHDNMKILYYLPLAILLIFSTTINNVIATPTHNSQQSARYHVETILNGLTKKWTTFRDFERYCLPSNTGRKDTTLSVVCKTLMDLFGGYKHLLSSRSGVNACSESSCDTQSCGMNGWLNAAGIKRLEEPEWYGSKKLGVFMKAAVNNLVEKNSDEELQTLIAALRDLHQEIRGNSHAFAKRDDVPGEASTRNDNREESQVRRTNSLAYSVLARSARTSANDGEILEEAEEEDASPSSPDAVDAPKSSSSIKSTTSNIEQELIETFTESIQVFLDHNFVTNDTELMFESVRVIEEPDGGLLLAFKLSEDGITPIYNPPPKEQLTRSEAEPQRQVPPEIRHNAFLDHLDRVTDKYFRIFNRFGLPDENIAMLTVWVASIIIYASMYGGMVTLCQFGFCVPLDDIPSMCIIATTSSAITFTAFSCCFALARRRERNIWEEMMMRAENQARNNNSNDVAADDARSNSDIDNDDNNIIMALEEAISNINVQDVIEENLRLSIEGFRSSFS